MQLCTKQGSTKLSGFPASCNNDTSNHQKILIKHACLSGCKDKKKDPYVGYFPPLYPHPHYSKQHWGNKTEVTSLCIIGWELCFNLVDREPEVLPFSCPQSFKVSVVAILRTWKIYSRPKPPIAGTLGLWEPPFLTSSQTQKELEELIFIPYFLKVKLKCFLKS